MNSLTLKTASLQEASADALPLLEVKDLATEFITARGPLRAVDGVSLHLKRGETLGLVGESGSGKSVLGRTIMGLFVNDPVTVVTGSVKLSGHNVHAMSAAQRRRLWGPEVAMVFQDPLTSLSPVKKVGSHLREPLRLHLGLSRAQASERALELLKKVGIPDPTRRMDQYPHELSGGMRQRVVIAMALTCQPKLLIADEPTTALDVTVQKQILDLLASLTKQLNMATILVSHDLDVVRGRTDRVAVMYGGRIVEMGATNKLFGGELHPYTNALLASIPRLEDAPRTRLRAIQGRPPDLLAPPSGCNFAPRCARAIDHCSVNPPILTSEGTGDEGHFVACYRPLSGNSKFQSEDTDGR